MAKLALVSLLSESSVSPGRSRMVQELNASLTRTFSWILAITMRTGSMAAMSKDEYVGLILGSRKEKDEQERQRLAAVKAHLELWVELHIDDLKAKGISVKFEDLIDGGAEFMGPRAEAAPEDVFDEIDRLSDLAKNPWKSLPSGRPPKVGPSTPLPPRSAYVLRPGALQTEMDWVRGRT